MWASFEALRRLHKLEAGRLLKYGYQLTSKALNPSNVERQNVKIVLQVFNQFTAEGLLAHAGNLDCAEETANFIKIIIRWWSVVNVKTLSKGFHKRDLFQEPVQAMENDPRIEFLEKFAD
ncbi:hypothetical protein HPB47_001502 [Ixodes persulcatus]|uniref:Uncharacterized protein n=1 Tax=Ixodes persulcatus TaxID=34615 RepID=A0AC60PQB3_IXOPE|nr:hypothetical protein HPB47_001502 [Ixodes persulcatus]